MLTVKGGVKDSVKLYLGLSAGVFGLLVSPLNCILQDGPRTIMQGRNLGKTSSQLADNTPFIPFF